MVLCIYQYFVIAVRTQGMGLVPSGKREYIAILFSKYAYAHAHLHLVQSPSPSVSYRALDWAELKKAWP